MSALQDWWQQIIAAVAFIGWLWRLEGRVANNARSLEALERRLANQRAEDQATHRREWTEMRADTVEMKQDIKKLLAAVARAEGRDEH